MFDTWVLYKFPDPESTYLPANVKLTSGNITPCSPGTAQVPPLSTLSGYIGRATVHASQNAAEELYLSSGRRRLLVAMLLQLAYSRGSVESYTESLQRGV